MGLMTLEVLLGAEHLDEGDLWLMKAALRSAWCWPTGGPSAERALRYRPTGPPPVQVGETCLLSVNNGGAALWQLAREASAPPSGAVSFVGSAAETAELAWLLAARDLPKLRTFRPMEAAHDWHAVQIAEAGGGGCKFLNGRSFGLALFLASASRLLERPLPTDLVALGEIDVSGAVRPVDGLPLKLDVIERWAAGVTRVLVAPGQKDEAQTILERFGSSISVRSVRRLVDAAHAAFPDLDQETFANWENEASARGTLESLFRQVLHNNSLLLGWASIANTAASLKEYFTDDADARERARFVEAVARRHEGGDDVVLEWPSDEWLSARPRPIRLEIAAHVLQSATDGFDPDLETRIEQAMSLVAVDRSELHAADLTLLGAIGRALAAVGEFERALAVLRKAVDGWLEILDPSGSSHALSELLRVLGVLNRADELDAVQQNQLAQFEAEPTVDLHSRAFMALALGRSLVLCGKPDRGLEQLEGSVIRWDLAFSHVVRSRDRWRARALAELGRTDEATAVRRQLATQIDGTTAADEFHLLARLDAALEDPKADPVFILEDLSRHREGPDVKRIIRDALVDRATAQRVADRWRY